MDRNTVLGTWDPPRQRHGIARRATEGLTAAPPMTRDFAHDAPGFPPRGGVA